MEKEKNIFYGGEEMRRGKGEKYLVKENMFLFSRRKEKKRGEGKEGKYLERSNIFFVEEKEMEVNIWKRKILVYGR